MSSRGRAGRTITHSQARRFYDRFAVLQDRQAFYESVPLDVLVRGGAFARARAVLELGCGTGRLAERLLETELPGDARYVGLDLSPRMVERARLRLSRFGARADVVLTDGSLRLAWPDASRDRVVAAYVLDLLSDEDIRLAVDEAHRVLVVGGLLCLASLSSGISRGSRLLCEAWEWVHRASPLLVGGCRPIDLGVFLDGDRWGVAVSETIVSFAVPTQVVVAAARR